MGTYHYSLRKRSMQVNILGEVVPVHAFSYLFKYHHNEESQRSQQLLLDRVASIWGNEPLPRFCFAGDWPTKEDKSRGEVWEVYTDLRSYGWDDCSNLPARGIGGLTFSKVGHKPIFLTARDFLIASEERMILSMMCSPEQPAIPLARARIEFYKTLPNPQSIAEQDVDAVRKTAYEATKPQEALK